MKEELPEETKRLLQSVVDHFDQEDRPVRDRQIRTWRKLKLYWEGYSRIWYSEVAHDWRIFDEVQAAQSYSDESYYDKPVNVFKAYLESIIAALSVTTPGIKCFPDDADNSDDLATAKCGDKIYQLVSRHNEVTYHWIHALFIYCTEGLVACYSYPKEDYKHGTYTKDVYEEVEEEDYLCSFCKQPVGEFFPNDEFMPNSSDVELHNITENEDMSICPNCSTIIDPNLKKQKFTVTRMTGVTEHPKSRQCIEVYGGLNVKVPNYARGQVDCPYLIYSYDTHYANVLSEYPDLRDKTTGASKIGPGDTGSGDPYERWGRLSPQYNGEYPENTVTVRHAWLRPCAFEVLNDEDDRKELKKLYPDGVKVTLVNEHFCDAENEAMDDCWTLTKNPLADFIHFDPLGLMLTSIQDITNDIVSLTLQTIEHGIPQTFADPAVLNFKAYNQSQVAPGQIFPASPKSGKSTGDAFYEVKTATLSQEVLPFFTKIQEAGQLVSGALPSLFGGSPEGGGKTAAEYSMSRAQALQRLQTPWKMLNIWWKEIFAKVIPSYIKDVVEDERFVELDPQGNFINVVIKKAELQGKLGSIEVESNEEIPISWAQKKDSIIQLLQAANPVIMEALIAPENLEKLSEAIGLSDFSLPGTDDRTKQYEEIKIMVRSTPIENPMAAMDPMAAQAPDASNYMPSIEPEPDVDNHKVHIQICRAWLVSEAGRLAKIENPGGYLNVLLHLQAHQKIEAMFAMSAQAQGQVPGEEEEAEGKPQNDKMMSPKKDENNNGIVGKSAVN